MQEEVGAAVRRLRFLRIFFQSLQAGNGRRVLFVPTGALMSTVSFNEGESVPGIAHGIVLEHC